MSRTLAASTTGLILLGMLGALSLRIAAGEPEVASSQPAAILFLIAMAAVAVAAGWRPGRARLNSVALGVLGAVVLVAIPVWLHLSAAWTYPSLPISSFPVWAVLVTLVATSEEIVLRGVLFNSVAALVGPVGAVLLTAVAFAAIHVPMYGTQAFPLDLAVGIWLGALRVVSGGVAAPAIAHVLTDLGTWWLL